MIPYHGQYQLDVQDAVGRIHFEASTTTPAMSESWSPSARRTAARPQGAFLGVARPDDRMTQPSRAFMVGLVGSTIGAWP